MLAILFWYGDGRRKIWRLVFNGRFCVHDAQNIVNGRKNAGGCRNLEDVGYSPVR